MPGCRDASPRYSCYIATSKDFPGTNIKIGRIVSQISGKLIGQAGFASFAFGGATVNEANASNWTVTVRAHRDFLP